MKSRLLLFGIICCFSLLMTAQDKKGSSEKEVNEIIAPDSLLYAKKYSPRIKRLIENPLTPSKAAFYSAIIPGLGQAYLGKAWKIPIIYAALGASYYYYDLQGKQMEEYRTAYKKRQNGIFNDRFLEKAQPA